MSEHIFQTDEFDGVFSVYVAPNIGISNITGQREEIVRCRDCGWCDDQGGFRWCGHWENGVAEDGFCAWGMARKRGDGK